MPDPIRPARPALKDAEDWNASVDAKIENKITRIKELIADVQALAADTVQDADDVAKTGISEMARVAGSFVSQLNVVGQMHAQRKAERQAKRDALLKPGPAPMPPLPPPPAPPPAPPAGEPDPAANGLVPPPSRGA